jgi:hypothetical protein
MLLPKLALDCNPPISTSQVAGTTDVCYCTWLLIKFLNRITELIVHRVNKKKARIIVCMIAGKFSCSSAGHVLNSQ